MSLAASSPSDRLSSFLIDTHGLRLGPNAIDEVVRALATSDSNASLELRGRGEDGLPRGATLAVELLKSVARGGGTD